MLATQQTELLKRIQNNRNLNASAKLDDAGDAGITSNGATFINDATRGLVADFDANSDTITLDGNLGVLGTSPRTVTGWIKTTDDKGSIVEWGTNVSDQRWWLRVVNGKLKLIMQNSNVVGSTPLDDGNWHRFAVVAPTSDIGDIKLYLDGVEETVTSTGLTFNTVADQNVEIGGDFIGQLDDIRIHERALSEDELDYYATNNSAVDLELALSLDLDEGSGATLVVDDSIYERNAVIDGVTLGFSDPTRGSVASFSGSDEIVVTEDTSDAAVSKGYNGVPGKEPRTVMAWINTSSSSGNIAQWGNHVAVNGEQFIVRIHNGKVRVSVKGGTVTGTSFVNDSSWHHVAIVAPDNILSNLKIFVDGVEETVTVGGSVSNFDTYTLNSAYDSETQSVTLKSMDVTIGQNFIGLLDDVIIHQTALSLEDVVAASNS